MLGIRLAAGEAWHAHTEETATSSG